MPFFFAVTLFISATQLFLVQPMIAKMILPSLGGTPAVWNTCQVFFQAVLLAGYAYAHYTTAWLGVRRQSRIHLALLIVPAFFLPLTLPAGWDPPGDSSPIPWLLAILSVAVGLPFFVVSTSAPLLQKWFAETGHPSSKDPYFLYGASNAGSMLTLLLYPTVIEPHLSVYQQRVIWSVGYGILVLLIAGCAYCVKEPAAVVLGKSPRPKVEDEGPAPTIGTRTWWIALAFVPSSLMLGVTTYLTTDIAAIPLLWVIPLALYLLSFIIVFAWWPSSMQNLMVLILPVLLLLLLFLMLSGIRPPKIGYTIMLHLATLFVVSLVCHGELARSRPSTKYLTGFYLLMSLGGVMGGLFNALAAPMIFTTVAEYPIVMVVACLLMPNMEGEESKDPSVVLDFVSVAVLCAISLGILWYRAWNEDADPLNFAELIDVRTARFWIVAALLVGSLAYYVLYKPTGRAPRLQDVGIAMALGLLTGALIIGLSPGSGIKLMKMTEWINTAMEKIGGLFGKEEAWSLRSSRLRSVLMFGVPPILCYTLIARPVRFGLAVGAVFLAGSALADLNEELIHRERSFYGVLSVKHLGEEKAGYRELIHGTTLHGMQSMDPARENEPLTYYHRTGPIGQVFEAFSGKDAKKNVALVGLGTGTLTCYGEPGQNLTIYEIDPSVLRIARDAGYFTYFKNCKANVEVSLGDARLRMKEAPADHYGIIVLDAFSSDAIPVHLMTEEALKMYLTKLAPGGIVAFHISNRYLDLEPVLGNLAVKLGLHALTQYDRDDDTPGKSRSHWVILAREPADFGKLAKDERWKPLEGKANVPVWTDDFSNIYDVFSFD